MPEDCKASATRTARTPIAQLCFSDELPPGCPPFDLPEGRMMMEVELDDLTLLIIRPGSMDRALYDEYNRFLFRVTTQGHWCRNPSRQAMIKALKGSFVI